jgi:predicted Zn-dependent peptidase
MIDSISKEQVMAALKRLVKPENFTIVITKPKSTRVKEIEEVAKAKSPADLLALAA